MNDVFKIEFFGLNPTNALGFDAVDENVPARELRQVMANWYVNMTVQYDRFLAECDYENDEVSEYDEEVIHAEFVGTFVVRDGHGNIVERVASQIVRHCPEIACADPVWFETRDPECARRKAEAQEKHRVETIRRLESGAYMEADDIPF